jgi:2'-5' RNA ligase
MSLQCHEATMRLFFAILLPEDVRTLLSDVQSELRRAIGHEGVRWEDPGRFHITLRFLGEVASEKLENVKQAGREAAGICAPFTLRIGDIGTFPERRAARVLWAGVENAFPEYTRLAEYLDKALAARGFEPGPGPYTSARRQTNPHVTIARVKTLAASKSVERALAGNNIEKVDKEGVFFVYNIVLVHSELRPGGSVYTVLETFPLAAH